LPWRSDIARKKAADQGGEFRLCEITIGMLAADAINGRTEPHGLTGFA
jgi:hypothetical protein